MRRAHAFHAATRSKIPSGSGLSAWGWFGMLEPWFHAHFWRGSSIFGCRFAWTLLVKPIGYWLTPVRGTWKLGAHTTLIFPCAYDLLWRLFLYICLFCSVLWVCRSISLWNWFLVSFRLSYSQPSKCRPRCNLFFSRGCKMHWFPPDTWKLIEPEGFLTSSLSCCKILDAWI